MLQAQNISGKVFLDLETEKIDLPSAMDRLSVQRREKLLRIRQVEAQKESAAVFLLLAKGLKEMYGINEPQEFAFGKYGKPYLENHPEIFFNLSHCRGAAACVIGDRECGIDIQGIEPVGRRIIDRVMSDNEKDIISSSTDPDSAFAEIWTGKEAFLKMKGTGISVDLRTVDTSLIKSIDTEVYKCYAVSVCFSQS